MGLREILVRLCEEHSQELRTARDERAFDSGDAASDEAERGELLTELSVEQAELAEVDSALARLQNGTYGICEITGRQIPPERLRVLPWARSAVPATARRERVPSRRKAS